MCREAGGCYYEAQMLYEQQQHDDELRAYEEAMYEEMAKEHYREEHGGCGSHEAVDLTCDECLVIFRVEGLL